MSVAAIESLLERRFHGATVHAKAAPPRGGWTTGISDFDRALGPIGVPHGRITELFGETSSGRTTIAYALLAACTARGDIGAYVDPDNALYAPAAYGAGIDLTRLIVVRPSEASSLRRAADALVRSGACAVTVLDGCSADVLQPHHYARLASHAEKNGTSLVVLSHGGCLASRQRWRRSSARLSHRARCRQIQIRGAGQKRVIRRAVLGRYRQLAGAGTRRCTGRDPRIRQ